MVTRSFPVSSTNFKPALKRWDWSTRE